MLSRETAALHDLTMHRYRIDELARDCSEGSCAVHARTYEVRIRGDGSGLTAERAQALTFAVHFVGDAHQPLRTGSRDNKGGNEGPECTSRAAEAP